MMYKENFRRTELYIKTQFSRKLKISMKLLYNIEMYNTQNNTYPVDSSVCSLGMRPYCQVLALFMNFLLMVTGPELSLDEHELLAPLEPEDDIVVPGVGDDNLEVAGECNVDDCCRSSALSRTSLIPPRLVRGSRGILTGGGGGGGSRNTESSSVSSDGHRERDSRGRDPIDDTDRRRPDAFKGEQASQANGEISSPPPNTSPKSMKLWWSKVI